MPGARRSTMSNIAIASCSISIPVMICRGARSTARRDLGGCRLDAREGGRTPVGPGDVERARAEAHAAEIHAVEHRPAARRDETRSLGGCCEGEAAPAGFRQAEEKTLTPCRIGTIFR